MNASLIIPLLICKRKKFSKNSQQQSSNVSFSVMEDIRLQTKLWRERGELTTGRHSVPPCTSSWADPSSKLGRSGCNGCFLRCNETFPHLSESSRSRNPRWMSGRLRAGGHKGIIGSWNSQFIPSRAVQFGFNGSGVTCQLTWACCVRGILVVWSGLILDYLNLWNKAAVGDIHVLKQSLEKPVYLESQLNF